MRLQPLLTADETRRAEEAHQGSLEELMERAGAAAADLVLRQYPGRVTVVCGKGNNGGDGLVTARELREMGFEVDALLLAPGDQLSEDARANLARIDGARHVGVGELSGALEGAGVIVDAIFGTGFAGAPRDPAGSGRSGPTRR